MPPSIKNLRCGVVAGGVALLAVVAVFLGIARLKGYHFHLDLPSRLGVDISQTANGFTYSQSQKGHTLFTIHASKLVQYKADQAALHDVTITLYGPEGSGRSDKIYGSDFLYDRKLGIARATGAVVIDFASPETRPALPAAGPGPSPSAGPASTDSNPAAATPTSSAANTIHVTTSNVVFNQNSDEASTDQRVNFTLARASGSAVGADYNPKTGVLVLDSQVALTTLGAAPASGQKSAAGAAARAASGSPSSPPAETVIHAAHAQLFRDIHQAYLLQAEASTVGRKTTADEATVSFRPDGSAQHLDAEGHVRIVIEDGAEVHASRSEVELDFASHPTLATLSGGVTYHDSQGDRTMQGSSVSATLSFTAAPAVPGRPATQQLQHAQFRNAVSFVEQQHSLNGDPNGSATREMSASTVDVNFAPGASGRAEAQQILGVGGASMTLDDVPSKGPSKATTIDGDQLLATLSDGNQFQVLDGKGDTKIVDRSSDGALSTSTGDMLHVTFAPAGQHGAAGVGSTAADGGSTQVETAVQTGHVVLVQTPAPHSKPAATKLTTAAASPVKTDSDEASSPLHATAQRVEYHAADQLLHLTGDTHIRNDTLSLTANQVDYHRDTGDATALGAVKATYEQQSGRAAPALGGDGPAHVIADHAQFTRDNNISIFYGANNVPARMWQGGDAVAAPVLELDRDQQTLDAHGARGDRGPVVHALLGVKSPAAAAGIASATSAKFDAQPAKQAGSSSLRPAAAPVRLTSVTLHYSDPAHRADLLGAVTAEQPSGTVHSDQAQVYLTPSAPGQPSQLDRLVATGHVVILQPGRRGTGETLVYTAADTRYVLTGAPGRPPRITDADKGTTTGLALLFKSADDSVEVSSQPAVAGASGSRARAVTDTHTPN